MNIVCQKCAENVEPKQLWHGLHKKCFMNWFGLATLEDFQDIELRRVSDEEQCHLLQGHNSTFFHGMFRKYSSTLAGKKYIMKIKEADYPELPATEYVCNLIFKSLNIAVPPFYFVQLLNDQECFVTENFMPAVQEYTLVHLYHFMKPHEQYDCETVVRIIGEKTGRIGVQEDFVYMTLADSLIGNNDRHGRNLAFIQSLKGYSLAPFYDNTSYIGIEINAMLGADLQPRGAIATASCKDPKMKEYIQEWERLGFGHVVDRFRKAVSLETIKALIDSSHMSSKRKDALFGIICKRNNEL